MATISAKLTQSASKRVASKVKSLTQKSKVYISKDRPGGAQAKKKGK